MVTAFFIFVVICLVITYVGFDFAIKESFCHHERNKEFNKERLEFYRNQNRKFRGDRASKKGE